MPQPFVPVGGILQANCRFTCAGQQLENVFNFDYSGLDFGPGAIAVANAIVTSWWPPLRGALSNQLRFVEIYMVDLGDQNGETRTAATGDTTAGARNAPPAPLSVTLCVSFRTARRGKSFRGRSYVTGLAADVIESQNVSEPVSAGILAAYNALIDAAGSNGVPMVVVSRKTGGIWRETGVATPITRAILRDTVVDSQRRRLPGRGN